MYLRPTLMSSRQRQLAQQAGRLAGLALFLATLPGCQSIAGSPSLAQVRIVDASPDAPALDVYQGSGVIVYNLGYPNFTSYVPFTPGTYPIGVDKSGSQQQLITATGTFNANAQYTVLIGNYVASLQEQILSPDQNQPAPAGQVSFRFLDQAPAIGPVDIYLVPSNGTLLTTKPIATGVSFNSNTGYINVASGTYAIVTLASGTVPTSTTASLDTATSVYYPSGAARTVVLLGNPLQTTPALLVNILGDYE